MASQIGYVYSANRLAERPFSSILHTSFNETRSPRLWEQMLKTKREVWGRCHWTGAGIDRLAQKFGESSTSQTPVEGDELELPETISAETHSLVYLSADAEEELDTLKENEIYIIGGIVDKNRHKVSVIYSSEVLTNDQFLCQNKADKYGIRTARLPIGTYLANMPTRKVLTVNQVRPSLFRSS
jgi:tRNA (guanine9-N1)-methyltransferase